MANQFPEFDMVTKTPDLLRIWWNNLSECAQNQVTTHLGHLPSLMDFQAYPSFVKVITRFWDDERMVFRFGNVELTPTIEEIRDCLESKRLYEKRKECPDRNILIPNRPTNKEMKNMFFLVRWGHESYFERFPNEFHDYDTWISTQTLAFSICLLGTMVFPQDETNIIDSRVVMVTHAIFHGLGKDGQKKYCDLAPVIVADIYRSLGLCKNGYGFFQGCNLLLQWWMSLHLATKVGKGKQALRHQEGRNALAHHGMLLTIRRFGMKRSKEAWAQALYDLREDNISWMFDDFMTERVVIQGKRFPFLILMGIRGMRPYSPNRVMRQFGRKQVDPKTANARQFVIDYENLDKVPYANDILTEWSMCSYAGGKSIAEDRYDAGYKEGYKEWLGVNLNDELIPGPHVDPQLEDVEARIQVQRILFQRQWENREREFQQREQEYRQREQELQQREYDMYKALTFRTQELAAARICLVQLDQNLERQITTLQQTPVPGRALLLEPFLMLHRHHIRGEAEKARSEPGPSS